MTFSEIWRGLTPLYDEQEAQAVARLLLEDGFGLSLTDIYAGGLDGLNVAERERLAADLKRLSQGEPVQYVVGSALFRGRRFHVGKGVLIPRVETAQLVDLVLQQRSHARRILDIGTGSGCIAISLALELQEAEVEAIDISPTALHIARENAEALGAEVSFRQADVFSLQAGEPYDVIVSNPPYIEVDEAESMSRNVLNYEPREALFTGVDDPLCFCRAIARVGQQSLTPGGLLAMEINPLHAAALPELLGGMGYREIKIEKDCYAKERFVRAALGDAYALIGRHTF